MSTGKALLALGAVLFIITILNINARRKRLGHTPKHKDAERLERKAEALRRELEALVVELSEFSRQANGQIDTRFAKLECSIRDADQRIAELTTLLDAAGVAVPQQQGTSRTGGLSTTYPTADAEVVGQRNDAALTNIGEADDATIDDSIMAANQEAAAGVSKKQHAPQVDKHTNESSGDRDAQICTLVDKGLSVADVAERLRCSIGEVELVLNLRGRG